METNAQRLSQNFTLGEFLVSEAAARLGKRIIPPPEVVENIRALCVKILQPIRDTLGLPITISSGYRPDWLNSIIGGSRSSDHMTGLAADFNVAGMMAYQAARAIEPLDLPFKQLIHEFGAWVHVSLDRDAYPRRQAITAVKVEGKTRYLDGILEV